MVLQVAMANDAKSMLTQLQSVNTRDIDMYVVASADNIVSVIILGCLLLLHIES